MAADLPATAVPEAIAPLAFLIGTWAGEGVGGYPTISDFRYGQRIEFGCYGRPVLAYTSSTWALDDGRPLARECGFWRLIAPNTVEVLLAHPTGFSEISIGRLDGQRVELSTDALARTASAKEVTALHRLYGLVEGDLMYAMDMAAVGLPLQPHLSARLYREDG